jgi:hypothetical protein
MVFPNHGWPGNRKFQTWSTWAIVWLPDQCGDSTSDKPCEVNAYRMELLCADIVVALIELYLSA